LNNNSKQANPPNNRYEKKDLSGSLSVEFSLIYNNTNSQNDSKLHLQ